MWYRDNWQNSLQLNDLISICFQGLEPSLLFNHTTSSTVYWSVSLLLWPMVLAGENAQTSNALGPILWTNYVNIFTFYLKKMFSMILKAFFIFQFYIKICHFYVNICFRVLAPGLVVTADDTLPKGSKFDSVRRSNF